MADLAIPDRLWAPKEDRRQGGLRRPLRDDERDALVMRRDEIAPWIAPFFGSEEDTAVADAIVEMYDAFPHMKAASGQGAALRVDQLKRSLAPFPAWAIARVTDRVKTRGYTRKEPDGRYVQERHWAPSDPEIFQMVEEECAAYARAHAGAVALLAAPVSPDLPSNMGAK